MGRRSFEKSYADCIVGSSSAGEKIQGDGILVVRGSSASLTGTTTSQNNGGMGLSVSNASAVFAYNSTLDLTGNGWHGCGLTNGSALRLYGAADWTVSNNADRGISVTGASQLETYGSTGTVVIHNNASFGLLVSETSNAGLEGAALEVTSNGYLGILVENSSSVYMSSTTTVSGNPGYGVCVSGSSVCAMDAGVTVSGNQVGVRVDDSSLKMYNCTVTGNGPTGAAPEDVELSFGARGTFNGNTIGTLKCDGTVLTRGDLTCP